MENIQDIVWACNPTNDTLGKIFQRLVRYSSETLEAQNIAFICENKINDQLADQKISMEKRKDIYLAFKEIINNISKHSKASNVSLTIESIYNNLECTIKDDGISFDLTDQKNHHTGNGLQNIIARIESIDGKINTNRSENSNTIKISIPI